MGLCYTFNDNPDNILFSTNTGKENDLINLSVLPYIDILTTAIISILNVLRQSSNESASQSAVFNVRLKLRESQFNLLHVPN